MSALLIANIEVRQRLPRELRSLVHQLRAHVEDPAALTHNVWRAAFVQVERGMRLQR